MNETWTCACGTENTGKFCTVCGSPRPAEGESSSSPRDPAASYQPVNEFTEDEAARIRRKMSSYQKDPDKVDFSFEEKETSETPHSVHDKPKKKPRVGLIIGIAGGAAVLLAGIVVAAFLIVSRLTAGETDGKVSDTIPELYDHFLLAVDRGHDIAVQYPNNLTSSVAEDGITIYDTIDGAYVLISREDGRADVKKYFKSFEEMLRASFEVDSVSEVEEVSIDGRTLYRQCTVIRDGDNAIHADRYLEPLGKSYVEYTAYGYPDTDANTALYYAVLSMEPSADAYNESLRATETCHNDFGNYDVSIPKTLQSSAFTSGFSAVSNDMAVFAAYFNSDAFGAAIYDRDDFRNRAAAIDGYVAALLGAESAVFTEGTEETVYGRSAYCYPMTLTFSDDLSAEGEFCIIDSDAYGCYFSAWWIFDDATGDPELLHELGENFVRSLRVKGAPQTSEYTSADLSEHGLGEILYKPSEMSAPEWASDSYIVEIGNDVNAALVIGSFSCSSVAELAQFYCDYIAEEYTTCPEIVADGGFGEGRYAFEDYYVRFYLEDVECRLAIHGYMADSETAHAVIWTDLACEAEKYEKAARTVIWSWR